MLPLHIACQRYLRNSPELRIELVDMLLSRCPEAVLVLDNDGYLPLHHACQRGNKDVLLLLLKVDRNSFLQETNNGRTPLRLAYRMPFSRRKQVKLLKAEQKKAIEDKKKAFVNGTGPVLMDAALRSPDLVLAVWEFLKPNPGMPKND